MGCQAFLCGFYETCSHSYWASPQAAARGPNPPCTHLLSMREPCTHFFSSSGPRASFSAAMPPCPLLLLHGVLRHWLHRPPFGLTLCLAVEPMRPCSPALGKMVQGPCPHISSKGSCNFQLPLPTSAPLGAFSESSARGAFFCTHLVTEHAKQLPEHSWNHYQRAP